MNAAKPVLLALALAVAAPCALAQVTAESTPTRFEAADTNDDGKVDRAEYDGFVEELVLLLDTDKDGKVARTELAPDADGTRFDQVDANDDGVLVIAEIVTFSASDFDALDADDDGFIVVSEAR